MYSEPRTLLFIIRDINRFHSPLRALPNNYVNDGSSTIILELPRVRVPRAQPRLAELALQLYGTIIAAVKPLELLTIPAMNNLLIVVCYDD